MKIPFPKLVLLLVAASSFALATAPPAGAQDCSYVPADCKAVSETAKLPDVVKSCWKVDRADLMHVYDKVNVLDGGKIYFVEDPGKTIDFRVSAMLVEKGGIVQAGSPTCPIGTGKGKLTIGLYGDDPTQQGTKTPTDPGITCMTNPGADPKLRCFPDPSYATNHYCTKAKTSDPCSDTAPPGNNPKNKLLEPYGSLNYDPNPFGYKTIGVAYGGRLLLYGMKGAKGLQDATWASQNDSNQHCVVPPADQSTLDVAEMKAWASLTGSSWGRLTGTVDSGDKTTITLDRRVDDWQEGDDVVIGATDWYPSHSEQRTIRGTPRTVVTPDGTVTQFEVDALKFPHNSTLFSTTNAGISFTNPVNRKAVETRAVVGLLSRSIKVYSRGKTASQPFPKTLECTSEHPDCYFGGHLIFRQGFQEVAIQGVEFKQLGQGGRMGHYPVHFHLAKSTAYTGGQAFVKDSSVWDSMTRFVVVHGTHELTIARNVGYLSMGHGYYIEDGSEIKNLLCHNLGVGARAALQQYVTEQAKTEHWCGGEPPPAARVVPPILDGSIQNPGEGAADSRIGSDTYMPTMFWMMNAYNEFVGNAAASVHGFGSCFWLLGAAVSGPSRTHQFDGLAGYNQPGFQAPLLRFRGNSCTSSPLALPTVREMKPADPNDAIQTGYTALGNPYLSNGAPVAPNYARPIVNGNYRPIQPDAGTTNCSENSNDPTQLQRNTKACVMTVLDRFSTSFNWSEVNFGSIWLRPWFYLFANGAVTDQLFGGLGFVTGGSWIQAPPAYLSLAQNSLFVGVTQKEPKEQKPFSQRSGPVFKVTKDDNLANYAPCKAGQLTCNIPSEGTGYWKGFFQPKRLISIYDGPAYADGNAFLNVGSWECNPQPCNGKSPCELELPCGIYSSTTQPKSTTDPNNMVVLDAAIGWKQPNLFYYPPAFTYRGNAFLKDGSDSFNQCFTVAPGDFKTLQSKPGGCRHNVLDRTRDYIAGKMDTLNVAPTTFLASQNQLDTAPIDFSTILVDLDGSLTGATGTVDGRKPPGLTTSVSRNRFFDAPSQSPECLSYGVQTSPYTFVSTMIGKLEKAPKEANNHVDPRKWPETPAVALYRQWKLAEDTEPCSQVCEGDKYGCPRATFMGVSSVHQTSYLTMTQPPGLSSSQKGALYYIDTASGLQSLSCVRAKGSLTPGEFKINDHVVVYNVYPQKDSKTTYELYVGEGAKASDLGWRYVRVRVHELDTVDPLLPPAQRVEDPCDPGEPGKWCTGMPAPFVKDGILTVTLDHRKLAPLFSIDARTQANEDYARCMPRDMCYYNTNAKRCERCRPGITGCLRQDDFLLLDVQAMNKTDAAGKAPLDALCQEWSTLVSGEISNGGGTVTMADCPAGGCLGFAFTMPSGFQPSPYSNIEMRKKLTRCFLESAWAGDALVQRKVNGNPADPSCGAPRAQQAADFCTDPMLELDPEKDAFIAQMDSTQNEGDHPALLVEGGEAKRTLVDFDEGAIDSFIAGRGLTRATLVMTTFDATDSPEEEQAVDAHPLLQDFAEGGNEDDADVGGSLATASTAGVVAVASRTSPARPLALPIGTRGRRLPIIESDGTPGVTWLCAVDVDSENGRSECSAPWTTPGGDYGPATAAPAPIGPPGTVMSWDVTADVLAGASSWLVKKRDESDPGGVAFHSDEGAISLGDPVLAPTLVLE